MTFKLTGLVAATHTPFDAQGQLALDAVEAQATHLHRDGVRTVFVGGTTGESHSLTVPERLALAKRWSEVIRASDMAQTVHVGSNCLEDAKALATQAAEIGAKAISALAPSYFKPKTVEDLVNWCAAIARCAPEIPFYFYDIPSMTGVNLPVAMFLDRASSRIPNLAGYKCSNPDLMAYQKCLALQNRRFDCPWGTDECLLAAMVFGATGAVGSTYNFAAPLYHRLIRAFEQNDWPTARREQLRSVQLVDVLAQYGFMAAAKCLMGWLDVPVGPPRLPTASLSSSEEIALRRDLEKLGYFDWGR